MRISDWSTYVCSSDLTRLVAVTHMSNVFGVLTPLEAIVRLAHEKGVPVLADGTQAVVHHAIDVSALDVDFYALTGHKLSGPTGNGALYANPGWPRSDERRVGNWCVRTCRARWAPHN